MGGLWLERNISVFLNHVLDLVANPRATPTHVDAVYARKCVSFIIRSVIGGMLGEKAQIAAAKEICLVIVKQMKLVGEELMGIDGNLHLGSPSSGDKRGDYPIGNPGFSLTHKFVTRKMNLHCDTLDAHNACQNELIHSHILLSPITFIFVSSSNCCKKFLSINLLQLEEVFCK